MDLLDKAEEVEHLARQAAIDNQLKKYKALPDTGKCYNCDEPTENEHRFCDLDCRDDFDYRLNRANIYER